MERKRRKAESKRSSSKQRKDSDTDDTGAGAASSSLPAIPTRLERLLRLSDRDELGRRKQTWLADARRLTRELDLSGASRTHGSSNRSLMGSAPAAGMGGVHHDVESVLTAEDDEGRSVHGGGKERLAVSHPLTPELQCDFYHYALQRVLEIVPSSIGSGPTVAKDNVKERLGIGRIEGQNRPVMMASAGHAQAVLSDLFPADLRPRLAAQLRVALGEDEAEVDADDGAASRASGSNSSPAMHRSSSFTGSVAASSQHAPPAMLPASSSSSSASSSSPGKGKRSLDVDGLLELMLHFWHLEHLRDTERLFALFRLATKSLDADASSSSSSSALQQSNEHDEQAAVDLPAFTRLVRLLDPELAADPKATAELFVRACTYDPVLCPEGRTNPEAKEVGASKRGGRGRGRATRRRRSTDLTSTSLSQLRLHAEEFVTAALLQRRRVQVSFLQQAQEIMQRASGVESTRLLEKLAAKHPKQLWSEARVRALVKDLQAGKVAL